MNNKTKFILLVLICVILSSCSATQKISVSGQPGTEIYTPGKSYNEMNLIGTIGGEGKIKLTLDGDMYYAYLLSKNPASNDYIPFALDYKNVSRAGAGWAEFGGIYATSAGVVATAVGIAVGEGVMTGVGAALLPVGIATWASASNRNNAIDHIYGFKYLSQQSTNEDITFTRPVITPVAAAAPATDETEASSGSSATDEAEVSVSTARVSDRSTRTFKDYGSMVEGRYVGTGVLSLGNETIEQYDNMVIEIVRVDKNTVEVSVIDADGEAFFSTPSQYTIKKPANNTYTLTHSDISKATIKINKNKKAVYLHPRVNIDGDIYTLKITATLQ